MPRIDHLRVAGIAAADQGRAHAWNIVQHEPALIRQVAEAAEECLHGDTDGERLLGLVMHLGLISLLNDP